MENIAQIELAKKLYVKTRECGSTFVESITGNIIDSNTCFYNCLRAHIRDKQIVIPDNIGNIQDLKTVMTTDLPFSNILIGKYDPSRKNVPADHRVIVRASEMLGIDIYILTSGTHIYKFGHNNDLSKTLCLLLHRNHYQLVNDETYIIRLQEVFINPLLVLDFQGGGKGQRRKRGKKKSYSYKDAASSKSKPKSSNDSDFSICFQLLDSCRKLDFGKKQRKRGKRRG
jgi:hypothetical protein